MPVSSPWTAAARDGLTSLTVDVDHVVFDDLQESHGIPARR